MKLALQKKDIRKSLDQLRDDVQVVRNLLEPFSAPTYSPASRLQVTAHSHNRHRSEERRTRTQTFDDFYEAVCNSFQCSCGAAHEANLRLRDSLELIFPMADGQAPPRLSLAGADIHVRARALTIDSQATIARNEDVETDATSTSDMLRTTWSRSRKPSVSSTPAEHRGIPILFDQHVGIRDLVPISDLCQYLRQIQSYPASSPPISPPGESKGIVARDGRGYTLSPKVQDLLNAPTVVSMDECLHQLSEYEMSRRKRLDLALHLTSAIVQFYPTRWIDLTWTWQNFSMLRDDSSHDLLITRRFYSLDHRRESVAPAQSKFWRTIRSKDPLLVRLGFALIELAYGKRLAEIRAEPRFRKQRTGDGEGGDDNASPESPENEWQKDMDDWIFANDLVDKKDIQDEVSADYQKLVATCLQCEVLQDAGTKVLSSQSPTFEEDLSRHVVEPLRKYHNSNWGPLQVAAF
jgi:hypothetical protein